MGSSNPHVFELLEEILESGRTPEEVCADCPELLVEVRRRWKSFRLIDEEVAALLPDEDTNHDPDGTRLLPRPDAMPDVPGYRLEGVLGHGGMGVVYRAWHLRLNRPVALKMLLVGADAQPTERERFLREAEAVATLCHPNIVQVHNAGEVDGTPFFTMELVEGGDLAQKIHGTPQPARQAAALVATLADAIHVAHQSGIVHRDLKPSNVLLTADGTPKVSDFGLARRLEGDKELTLSGNPMGTPSYMAPEQARGDKHAVGPATDVYALGAILYELLTGRPPFRAETPTATLQQVVAEDPVSPARLNPRVPRDLETICLKCLHKEPHRRYETAAALAEDLRRFERGEPIKARRVGPMERVSRWAWRRPALAGSLATGVLLACTLVGTILWWYGQRMALEASAIAYAEADLNEAARLRDNGEFKTSAEVLTRAKERLRDFVPPELGDRLQAEFDNLELVTRLDAIRLERAFRTNRIYVGASTIEERGVESLAARQYEEAFQKAGLGTSTEDSGVVAGRVRASPVRAFLVAALDDWSLCALDRDRRVWVLAVARGADPDPWRDRVRDPMTWEHGEVLAKLADEAPLDGSSPHLLVALVARLRLKKGLRDNVPPAFLTRVALAHPRDFWVNVEMGYATQGRSRWEAIGYFKTALTVRSGVAPLHFQLGAEYMDLGRPAEAVHHLEEAVRFAPHVPLYQNLLGFLLREAGQGDKAIIHFREAERLEPRNELFWQNLDTTLLAEGRIRQALRQVTLGRGEDVCLAWQKRLAAVEPDPEEWFGYAELCLYLGLQDEYHKARLALLSHFGATPNPAVGQRVGRACLLLPVPDDELRQVVALTDAAVAAQRENPLYLFAQGLARYRQGRFDETIKLMDGGAAPVLGPCPRLVLAMAQFQKGQKDEARKTLATAISSNDWSAAKADNPDAWIAHILRREAETLIQGGASGR